ncbi:MULTISPECIES: filamentous hemagglutinin N-terminal domain-containing protein [Pseudanabaena]|uniref:Filamentous hemagglutinin family outer membrane protein n=2 Tax=Pseudanabaena TaxID=1152 RepID=L8N0W6_9CYAN|nr:MULTISPECIES: S-layer family protein [Pseudanabaena]ELS33356.1 filamentous hemagglutinin family outer membrane protein [Pseudanabaena biceps PCC 7429]MDG3494420.1 S-layer family protein [Pseudanabaena catenata USMAC16]
MNFSQRLWWYSSTFLFWGMFLPIAVTAQPITADGTLSTTVTSPDNLNFTITNGNQPNSGANLFHSFSQFSVPTGGSATFNLVNTPNITTIFSRVTGGSVSNIDGLIQTINNNNPVSLFLLNPSGIIFGANASLNIGGSFIGTTANSVIFSDGVKFSANDLTSPPLLTVSAPIGLQLEANAGAISLQAMANLQVAQGNTLALVGSQIDMKGANLTASDGRVEMWAAQNAQIALNNQASWQLASDPSIVNWGNISLSQTSLVDASGTNGGAINIRGRGLTLQDGSNIRSITSAGQGKGITVQTTDFVDLMGASDIGQFAPGISTSVGILFGAPASGQAGDVTVETGSLRLSNGAWLQSSSNGDNSRSGNVTVKAKDVDVLGANPFVASPTAINSNLFVGKNNESGKITIDADRIRVQDGGIISTALVVVSPVRPTGKAGDISIRAKESLIISGYTPDKLLSGVSSRIGATDGEAGNISIDVGSLQIFNGGTVRSTLSGKGKAGNINIQAKEVTVSDPEIDALSSLPGGITVSLGANAVGSGGNISLTADSLRLFNGGQITSSTNGNGAAGSINLQVKNITVDNVSKTLSNGQILTSTIAATSSTKSDAGSVNIVGDRLDVLNGAEISVSNTGGGNAGNLSVSASRVQLDYGGSLRSEVSAGDRGNISINTNVLLLRHGSQISTNATGNATGGNINIKGAFIVAVPSENSDITANALRGAGGNINITTQGLFGLKFRPQLTPESDITASSQFGLSGTVNINNLAFTPTAGLIQLPSNIDDPSQRIAQGCRTYGNSRFVATGRGGLPENPSDRRSGNHPWTDIRNLSTLATVKQSEKQSEKQSANVTPPIVEATGWQINAKGEVRIYAANNDTRETAITDCTGFLAVTNKAF